MGYQAFQLFGDNARSFVVFFNGPKALQLSNGPGYNFYLCWSMAKSIGGPRCRFNVFNKTINKLPCITIEFCPLGRVKPSVPLIWNTNNYLYQHRLVRKIKYIKLSSQLYPLSL